MQNLPSDRRLLFQEEMCVPNIGHWLFRSKETLENVVKPEASRPRAFLPFAQLESDYSITFHHDDFMCVSGMARFVPCRNGAAQAFSPQCATPSRYDVKVQSTAVAHDSRAVGTDLFTQAV